MNYNYMHIPKTHLQMGNVVLISVGKIMKKIFTYKIFMKTKDDQWELLSTHKNGIDIRVLNIYPSGNKLGANAHLDEAVKIDNVTMKFNKDQTEFKYPKSASLKVWMEGGLHYISNVPDSIELIINVTLNSVDEFETSEENFIYQFDVVVGFW